MLPASHKRPAPRVLALVFALAVAACGGDDGAGPDSDEPASIEIANADINLTQPAEVVQLEVTVRNAAGDVLPDAEPTFATDAETVASVSASGLVQGLGDGEAVITVSAGTVTAAAAVTVQIASVELDEGVSVTGLAAPTNAQRYYTLEVPAGSEDRVLMIRLQGGTGDADMVVRHGARPVESAFDCISAGLPNVLDNLEFCAFRAPEAGTWHVLLLAFETYAGVSLEAALVPVTDLTSATPEPDLQAADFEVLFFRIAVPQGSALDVTTSGGTGDADLFGTPFASLSITDVGGLPCLSADVGNDESCTATQTEEPEGPWMVMLLAYEAFAGVTLTAQVGAGG
jgi:hypothetical protein